MSYVNDLCRQCYNKRDKMTFLRAVIRGTYSWIKTDCRHDKTVTVAINNNKCSTFHRNLNLHCFKKLASTLFNSVTLRKGFSVIYCFLELNVILLNNFYA